MCAICSDGSGNGHRLKNISPVRHQGEHFNPRLTRGNIRGFRGSTCHRKSGYDLQKKITIYIKIKLIIITMLQPSRANPGDPASIGIWRRRRVQRVVRLAKQIAKGSHGILSRLLG